MDPFPELFDLPNQTGQSKQKEEGELFLITKEECESLHGDLDQISCPSDTLNANFVFDNFDFHNPQFSEYEIAAFDEFFTLDNNGADMNTHQVGPDSENEIIVKPSIIHHVETESEDESGSEITDGDISITDTDDSLDSYDNMSDESDTLIREDDSEVQRYQTPPSTPQTSCTNCCSVIKELKSLLVVHMAQVKSGNKRMISKQQRSETQMRKLWKGVGKFTDDANLYFENAKWQWTNQGGKA